VERKQFNLKYYFKKNTVLLHYGRGKLPSKILQYRIHTKIKALKTGSRKGMVIKYRFPFIVSDLFLTPIAFFFLKKCKNHLCNSGLYFCWG